MYAQAFTHPNLTYIVGILGRYLSNPRSEYWKVVKRVILYLQRTKNYILTYRRSSHLEIIEYSDFNFARCLDNIKSILGYVFILTRGVLSWKNVKQMLIATSTIETKFITY